MKKFFFVLILPILGNGAIAQTNQPCSTCLPEGITFNTQAQIDNFQTNYPNCTEILGGVTIYGNDIANLNGLSGLVSIGRSLTIGDWDSGGNPSLTSLTGLDNLISIGDTLEIYYNDALTSLTGLENVTSIGGGLSILSNDALTSLTGLDNLTSIGDHLYITGNDALTNLTGLDNLTSIGDYFYITGNNALNNLTGLDNLTSVGGLLRINFNNALTSLTGLDNLTSIGDYISIIGNDALTSLTGLGNLTSLGGGLAVRLNEALTSLTGLDNIDGGFISELYIYENVLLSTCDVKSVCSYLASPNGTVEIYDNAIGCNSPEEVEAACGVGFDESAVGSRQSAVNIYPNPSSSRIIIGLPTTPDKNTFLTIYNLNGQALISRQVTEQEMVVDISGLSQGVYFVKMNNDRMVQVEKFVKK